MMQVFFLLMGLWVFLPSYLSAQEGKVFYILTDSRSDEVDYHQWASNTGKATTHIWDFKRQPEDRWVISLFTASHRLPLISTEVLKKPLSFLDSIVCRDRQWMQEQEKLYTLFPDQAKMDYRAAFWFMAKHHYYEKDGRINVKNWWGDPVWQNKNRVYVVDKAFFQEDSLILYEVIADVDGVLPLIPTYILLDRNSSHIRYCSNEADTNFTSCAYRCWDFYNDTPKNMDSIPFYLYQPDPCRLGLQDHWLIERKPLTFLDSIKYYDEEWLIHNSGIFLRIPVRWDDKRPRGYVLDRATIHNDSIVMYEVVLSGTDSGEDFYQGYNWWIYICK